MTVPKCIRVFSLFPKRYNVQLQHMVGCESYLLNSKSVRTKYIRKLVSVSKEQCLHKILE